MRLQFVPYVLNFKRPSGTSRGVLTEKITCLIRIFNEQMPEKFGIGEAGIFPGLSPEANDTFFYKLMELQANVRLGKSTDLTRFPSLQSGLEQAIRDFSSGCKGIYYDSDFIKGEQSIVTNGLIWMGDFDRMQEQIESKISQGFRCIKIKIGAIDWNKELELIKKIRERYDEKTIEIRVDANGAFTMDNVLPKLKQLADYSIHSIEQPIKAGTPELMKFLCEVTPLPIALDEELIGKFTYEQKAELISTILPQYIILKPSLIGGFSGAEEWIKLANENGVKWWVTSALESNIGLNAIAQWTATLNNPMPQGLGTGALFTNNFTTPIFLEGEYLKYDKSVSIDYELLNKLDWRE